MRRHAPTRRVLPALLLFVFMAAVSLCAVPAAGATAVEAVIAAGTQAAKPGAIAAAPQAPETVHDGATVHDDATVHRGSTSPAHPVRLLLAIDPGGDHPHPLRFGATGAAATAGDLDRRATTVIQGRAPPAAC
ncbi:MAG: hypothetical protein ACRDTH_29885 [Pseudonocardiaceae bacterium]